MKKIMFLVSTNGYSGAEKVNLTIIDNLYEEYCFAYASTKGNIEQYLDARKVKHCVLKKFSIKDIKKAIGEFKPDIIHATDYKASVMVSLIKTNIPIISHIHNNSPWLKYINFKSIIYLIASKRFKKILTVSKSIENEYVFSKLIYNKIQNVFNPILRDEILKKISSENIETQYDICFVGRICKQKDPFKFVEIIEKIKKRKTNVKSIMIGYGSLYNDVQQYIISKKLEENIEMIGFVKNPYVYMNKSKIFCLTSKWEGFGLVAFEALTLGLPCVVSNVGGLTEIVTEKCGRLCSNTEEYTKEIFELLINTEYYLKKSKEAVKQSKTLENIPEYTKKIKKIYTDILKG